MKRRITLFLLALVCLLCAAAFASAENLEYTLLEDGSGYEITGCDASAETVVIPAAYEGLPVTAIAGQAFLACENLEAFETEEGRKWVLFASMENQEGQPEPRTMYFVGRFEGGAFTAEEKTENPGPLPQCLSAVLLPGAGGREGGRSLGLRGHENPGVSSFPGGSGILWGPYAGLCGLLGGYLRTRFREGHRGQSPAEPEAQCGLLRA